MTEILTSPLYIKALSPILDLGKITSEPDEQTVHEARVGIKRLRALIELVQALSGKQGKHRKIRKSLRKLAHILAARRDRDVQLALMGSLQEIPAESDVVTLLRKSRRRFARQTSPHYGKTGKISCLVEEIALHSPRLASHNLAGTDLLAYCRKAMADVCSAGAEVLPGTDWEAFHTWRKQVKRTYYQWEALDNTGVKQTLPGSLLHELGNALGEINDLCVLEQYLQARRTAASTKNELPAYEKLLQMINVKRQAKRAESKAIHARLCQNIPH